MARSLPIYSTIINYMGRDARYGLLAKSQITEEKERQDVYCFVDRS